MMLQPIDESSYTQQKEQMQRNNDSSYCDESAFGMVTQNDMSYINSNHGAGNIGIAERIVNSQTTTSQEISMHHPPLPPQ